ncbi:MAG TPA: 16S rRNA pseudouridine(516) synthase [Oceanospirillaceae bacterium]|nr:16S rRNA pseudouridine(516) synthase [Oceanospirillaceae bacterium]
MPSYSFRLDKIISQHTGLGKRDVKLLLARQRVLVDDVVCTTADTLIGQFTQVQIDGDIVQSKQPVYIVLNKPKGVVSATTDAVHQTVLQLLPSEFSNLHIAGRLDLNSTGLMLLTNDGSWSSRITGPDTKLAKRYRVTVQNPLGEDYIQAFVEGMYFAFEDITTAPAQLQIVSDYVADVTLTEGRYHQIKRMFGRFRNPVVALHRYQVGGLCLPADLAEGEYWQLSKLEAEGVFTS